MLSIFAEEGEVQDNFLDEDEMDSTPHFRVIPIDDSFEKVGDDFITFSVNNVLPAYSSPKLTTAREAFEAAKLTKSKLEDFSHKNNNEKIFIAPTLPAPIIAIHTAFMEHYHLVLSPSDFIIWIGQALSHHVRANAEKLRYYFVNHEKKELIEIVRPELKIGKNCDWSVIFPEFAEEIRKRIKLDFYDIVIDDTSVATSETRIVSQIALMDAMQHYFDYKVAESCGFPKITLKGTVDDWKKLKSKVEKLEKMNKDDCLLMGWWLKQLVPIVNKICEAGIDRKIDRNFWTNIQLIPGTI